MPFSVILDGTVLIGEGDQTIAIPINTTIPPATPGEFVFDYQNDDPADAAKINVGPFIVWVANTFGIAVKDTDLPTSLQTMSIAVLKLHFDTKGNVEVKIQIGSMVANKWESIWTPIDALPKFKLDSLTIETTNMQELVDALLATDQLVAQAA
jgi:hypothetical protein